MSSSGVQVRINGPVMEITLDRPPANAINPGVSLAINQALQELQSSSELQVGLITGGGERFFSAGWDLKEIATMDSNQDALDSSLDTPGGFAGITEYWDLKKPVIAAINGIAVGGGFEIALVCDLVVAAEHAEFFFPEMQRGFLPDVGGIQMLPRKFPYNVAMDLLYTGRRMSAGEAKQWGFVRDVVPANELMNTSRILAREVAKGAPLALQALKEVAPEIDRLPIREAFSHTKPDSGRHPVYQQMLRSEDFMEGPRAFAEKREPRWKGR